MTNKGFAYDYGNADVEIISQNGDEVNCVASMELISSTGNKTYDKVNLVLESTDGNLIVTSYNK